jgi:hypothetical protein
VWWDGPAADDAPGDDERRALVEAAGAAAEGGDGEALAAAVLALAERDAVGVARVFLDVPGAGEPILAALLPALDACPAAFPRILDVRTALQRESLREGYEIGGAAPFLRWLHEGLAAAYGAADGRALDAGEALVDAVAWNDMPAAAEIQRATTAARPEGPLSVWSTLRLASLLCSTGEPVAALRLLEGARAAAEVGSDVARKAEELAIPALIRLGRYEEALDARDAIPPLPEPAEGGIFGSGDADPQDRARTMPPAKGFRGDDEVAVVAGELLWCLAFDGTRSVPSLSATFRLSRALARAGRGEQAARLARRFDAALREVLAREGGVYEAVELAGYLGDCGEQAGADAVQRLARERAADDVARPSVDRGKRS